MALAKFFRSSPDLLCDLSFSWLDTKSIVRLDSSFCRQSFRTAYLRFLASDHTILPQLPPPKLAAGGQTSSLRWAANRLVKCRTLQISTGTELEILYRYFRKEGYPVNVHIKELKSTFCISFMIATHSLPFAVQHLFRFVCGEEFCTSLKEIFFHDCTGLSADAFEGITCTCLETLALFGCFVDDRCIESAVGMSDQICNLNIGENNLSDKAVRDAVTKLQKLRKLALNQIWICDATIAAIAAECKLLSAIDLQFCYSVSDAATVTIATECKHLEQLILPLNTNQSWTRVGLLAIAHNCPRLRRLETDYFIYATPEDVMLLLDSCTQLEKLGLCITNPAVAAHLPRSITTLDLVHFGATDELLVEISRRCANLSKFILPNEIMGGANMYSEHGRYWMRTTANSCPGMRNCAVCEAGAICLEQQELQHRHMQWRWSVGTRAVRTRWM